MRISQIDFPFPVPSQGYSGVSAKDRRLDLLQFPSAAPTQRSTTFTLFLSRRREGIGSFLVQTVTEITDSLGVDRIDLNVRRDNPNALKFWESQGFMIGHHELTQFRDPDERIGFRGALSSDFAEANNP